MIREAIFLRSGFLFQCNNLGLVLGVALKFYRSVAKVLKLNVRKIEGSTKFLRLEKIRGKRIDAFLDLPLILNKINNIF